MSTPLNDKAGTAQIRAELAATLDAIEDKFNVPLQVSLLQKRVRRSYALNPLGWLIGATAAVVVVGGLIAWAVLSDD